MKNLIFCRVGEKWAKYGPFVLRVVVGTIFAVHGYQKLSLGAAGVGGFLGSLGVPAPLFFAYVVTYLEFLGGIALVLGFLTRLVSVLLTINMLVALFLVHLPKGFYVNGGGYEFVLSLLAATAALCLTGGGAWSLDDKISRKESAPIA